MWPRRCCANSPPRSSVCRRADKLRATGEEKESIIEWRKYRIALSRIDVSAAPNVYWPSEP
ncbi:tail fiber assembly protein [Serratia sp. PAMC26656]|uniref:tail fiber assembly protein n=1 Tax=Serratia sp. PAMC26656 TaxID=2775909 RepID=UPI00351C3DBD